MAPLIASLLFVIATWWLGTGVVLYLQQRLRAGESRVAIVLCAAAAIAVTALMLTSSSTTNLPVHIAFVAAVALWGVLELANYLGFIAGSHRQPCPPHCRGWQRFRLALGTGIHHDLSVVFSASLLAWLLWPAANHTGLYTFLVLWLMRWSAKLNLFLGVPSFNTEWFPEHLAYLTSYMKRSSVSVLFPVSLCLASLALCALVNAASDHSRTESTMYVLPAILLALAILEHLFMVIPVADNKLWNRVFNAHSKDDDKSPKPPLADHRQPSAP